MAAMKKNTTDESDGATRIYNGNFQIDARCEISEMFRQLSSWSKEREESQKQLDTLLTTFDHTINNKVNELNYEVDNLQDQLSAMTKERDDLLVYVEKLCDATEKLKAKIQEETLVTEPEENIYQHSQDDSFEVDCQDSDIPKVEIPDTEVHDEESVTQESILMESDVCDKENELNKHFCPNCHLFFSTSDNLKVHLQTIHSKLEIGHDDGMVCNECDKVFKNKGSLYAHRKEKHIRAHMQVNCTMGKMQPKLELSLSIPSEDVSTGPYSNSITTQKIKVSQGPRSLNSDQHAKLNQEFEANPHLDKERGNNLSDELGLDTIQIRNWFRNKRVDTGIKRLWYFNSDQHARLNREFEVNPYPNKRQRNNLSDELGVNTIRVRNWFRNKRVDIGIKREWFFNSDQLARLNQEFEINPYPNTEQRNNLSDELRIDTIRIRTWFQRKRIKKKTFKRNQKNCSVPGCATSKVRHRLPSKEPKRQAWIEALNLMGVDLPKDCRICLKHFKPQDYNPVTHNLFKGAVPCAREEELQVDSRLVKTEYFEAS